MSSTLIYAKKKFVGHGMVVLSIDSSWGIFEEKWNKSLKHPFDVYLVSDIAADTGTDFLTENTLFIGSLMV